MDCAPPPRDTPLFEQFRVPGCDFISPELMADALAMEPEDLAGLAQVPPTIPATHPADLVLQAFLNDVLDVLEALHAHGVDMETARTWLVYETVLDGRTPVELVAAARLDAVLKLVENLSAGATG